VVVADQAHAGLGQAFGIEQSAAGQPAPATATQGIPADPGSQATPVPGGRLVVGTAQDLSSGGADNFTAGQPLPAAAVEHRLVLPVAEDLGAPELLQVAVSGVSSTAPQPRAPGLEILSADSGGLQLAPDPQAVAASTATEIQPAELLGFALHDGFSKAPAVAVGRSLAARSPEGQARGVPGLAETTAQRGDSPAADKAENGQAATPPDLAALNRTDRMGLAGGQQDLPVAPAHIEGRRGEAVAALSPEPVSAGTEALASDWEAAPPQQAGLLGDASLADEGSLHAAVRQFFLRLDDLGRDLNSALARSKLLPWLLAGAMGALAVEAARQYLRRARPRPGMAADEDEDEDTLTWVPGLPDPVATEES
jgi:hypothetical protein